MCYRDSSSALLAGYIYLELVNIDPRLKIFYAPKCIDYGDDFVEKCEAIAGSVSLMIVIINNQFFSRISDSEDVVSKELRSALKNKDCKFLPVLSNDVDFRETRLEQFFSEEDISRITHINPIRFTDVYTFDTGLLRDPILEHFGISKDSVRGNRHGERSHIATNNKGKYFSDENNNEKRRLLQQQALLLKYDMPIYDKMIEGKKDLCVLDLGTGNGSTFMNRFGMRPEVKKLIGIEYNELNVVHANEQYGSENVAFYQGDVEADDFIDRLEEIMDENGIEAFDFINILALMSHLKSPSKLLKKIRKVCSPDAQIFIRNIDDGLNVAYPDRDGAFEKALDILVRCNSSGYRFSGRELFTYLKKWGYSDISLERTGIHTVGMTQAEKEGFFDVIFKFVRQCLKYELEGNPDSKELQRLTAWLEESYEQLEDEFMSPEFFFHFGFIIYTAHI